MAAIYFAKTKFSNTWMVVRVAFVKDNERDALNLLLRQHGNVASREGNHQTELEKMRYEMEEAGHTLIYSSRGRAAVLHAAQSGKEYRTNPDLTGGDFTKGESECS